MREKIVLLLAVLILVPMSARADLIVNGSFEDPIQAEHTWSTYSSIPGWTATAGIEIRNAVAGIAYDGNNFAELDTNQNSAISQTVATNASSYYNLSYYYAPRQNESADSNYIELWFNGVQIDSVTGYSTSNDAWSLRSFSVIGTGSDIVTFKAAGFSNVNAARGGSIDGISMELSNVPEPTSLILLGSGLGMIGLAAWRKRK